MTLKDTWSLQKKAITNPDHILKYRDITLPTKIHIVKAMVFPVVMYGCESWIIKKAAAAAAKSLQSCPTLCDPRDGSPPGSPVPGILQARTLEWVAISFSNVWKWKVKMKLLTRVRLLATPWTAAHQAPPSMWFSRQEYWSGVPLPSLNSSMLLSRFSCVRLCATAETAAHPSMGFSRQEQWSGLPFPSPVHESEKWKWSCSVVSNS